MLTLLVYKKKLRRAQWLGIVIAASGVSLIILSGKGVALGSQVLIGNLVVFVSAIMFTMYAVFAQHKKYNHLTAFDMIFIATALGSLVLAPFALTQSITSNWVHHAD